MNYVPPEDDFDDDGLDLSLFEEAINNIENDSPTNEYSVIRQTIERLAEKYGIKFGFNDGREIDQPMALIHRLDDFISRVGGISSVISAAILDNKFTKEMSDEVLSKIMDEERLFTATHEELQMNLEVAHGLIEVLIHLGESEYAQDHDFVADQKAKMISDLRSYDLILSTIHRYAIFLQEYIAKRELTDQDTYDLNEAMEYYIFGDNENDEKDDDKFKGYKDIKAKVLEEIKRALSSVNADRILGSELREIVRVYKDIFHIGFTNDGYITKLNEKSLNECISLISRLE